MSEQFRNELCALVDAQHAAVRRQMIILRVTPLHIGVKTMICGAALILIPQAFLGSLLPFAVYLDDALGAESHVRRDKDLQAVCFILQNGVGTATDDDAGPFSASSAITLY